MSSTPAVVTNTPVAPSVSSNVALPSSVSAAHASSLSSDVALPSSVSATHASSLSSGVNTISLPTSFTTSPTTSTSALITSAFSEHSQQPSSVFQITTTMTTVATTTVPSHASPSVLSSTASFAPAKNSSMSTSTTPSAIISSNDNRSATSTPETSTQPTTPSMAPTQPPTLIPSSLATISMTTSSSAPVSASSSNIPFTTASLPLHSNLLSQSSSPGKTEAPLYEFASDAWDRAQLNTFSSITVLESTTIFITTTNSQGVLETNIPPVVTEVITTTGRGGIATTITQAIVNPTLAPNNSTTENSSFFTNTGAVVGVFVVVGLASASIMMWILFAIRRRQRMKRIEQDTAVEAAVAAAGLNRTPLDDDDEDDSPISSHTRRRFTSGMGQRRSLLGFGSSRYLSTSARLSEVLEGTIMDSVRSHQGSENHTSSHPEEYAPAPTISSSPGPERRTNDLGSSRDRKSSYGHTPTYSAGSFEPLLANYVQNTPDQDTSISTSQPPQNHSPQHLGSGLGINRYSSDGGPEDASRTSSKRQNSSDSSVLQDEELYTRGVLMVRNVPDDQSQHSL